MSDRRAPESVLVALAEAVDKYCGPVVNTLETWNQVQEALAAYRAAIAPVLRSRAEVDAEIVLAARSLGTRYTVELHNRLNVLSTEPTRPDSSPGDESTPLDPDERPCGCESEVALRAKLQHIREVCPRYQVSCCAGDVLRILDEP